ncbi:DUF302 domain-containing protein [Paracoccus sp. p4-l81]|uniref:DUF302 domain-containing protein n=1 Tax=unclassified Paracoccus (in: a-proteobacteria) TaxID=2688777 RepID=UPI0035BB886C
MSYSIDRLFPDATLDQIDPRTRAALTANGFGVLTEIDVQATMKKKLDKDLPGYRILGACHPGHAYRALTAEPRIGTMLPCNVILREVDGGVEVSAVDPVASMKAVGNPEVSAAMAEVKAILTRVIAAI